MSTLSQEAPQASNVPVADWFDHTFLYDDPLKISQRMRQEGHEIMYIPMFHMHFTCSTALGRAIWNDPKNWCNLRGEIPLTKAIGPNLMFKRGEEHAKERAAIMPSLRPKTVQEAWEPVFRRHAAELIDKLIEHGPGVDLNEHFAVPYAARNLAAIAGLNEVPWQDVAKWSHAFIKAAQNQLDDPSLWPPAEEARNGVDAAIDVATPRLKANPDASMLSSLVNGPSQIPLDVIRGSIRLGVAGAMNEPQHAILHGLWALERHPEQKARLLKDPTLFPQAFAEVMRWLPPITAVPREAMNPVTVHGIDFKPGQIVVVQISGANRDPKEFEDPDTFNILRKPRPDFSFGGGEHLCAGIWITRATVQIAWKMLYERLEGLRVIEPEHTPWFGFVYRGIEKLPVTWDAVRAA